MKQTLVLFTADFPFGTGETFLETEINYLCDAFEKVTIVSQNTNNIQTRIVPPNCIVQQIPLDYSLKTRFNSLFQVFSPIFWKELTIIKRVYQKKISLDILKTMLISLKRGKEVQKYIYENFGSEIERILFYSYWCDDTALGIALAQENGSLTGITRIHGWDLYFNVHTINYLPFRKFISDNLTAMFPISEKGKTTIMEQWRVQHKNIIVSRLGITNFIEMTQKPFEKFRIVSCSNVISLKRIDLIIDALKQIENLHLEWTHFGDGNLMDSILKKAENLPSHITANFKGRIVNSEIFNYYKEHQPDLFINVSSSEGIPVSIMEAMSFGIPVIATEVGGTSEIVTNENGSLLSPNPTPTEIALSIRQIIKKSESDYDKMRKSAFETWKNHYNATVNYKQFVKILKEL